MNKKEFIKNKYDHYLRESDKLHNHYETVSSNLDKLVFALASGTVVLSLTFIASQENVNAIILLKISYIFLIGTLIFNLITYPLTLRATKKSREQLDRWLLKTPMEKKSPDISNITGEIGNILNMLSIFTLISGIIALTIFTFYNLEDMPSKKPETKKEKSTSIMQEDETIFEFIDSSEEKPSSANAEGK